MLRHDVLLHCIDRFVSLLISAKSTQRDAFLAWDRVDAVGNCLFTLICLNPERFQQGVEHMIMQQTASVQTSMSSCFGMLLSSRGLSADSLDKPNRMKFVANFREFVTNIKSLSMR